MTIRILAAALGALALAACGDAETNISNNATSNVAVTGDLNSAIGGDELSPIPEAEDDAAANLSDTNLAAPPPAVPGAQNSN
ncbi:hypothetical protein [Sphingosinicella sp. YJ22]|uniref:hypothetical protein n=1 Tax=Sphingosinicella sp. YJ22 TaxID=1104780 RepID=UPI00140B6CC5|nr:hypothetical protein [Sphingosinicella sp. YJ22]